MSYHRDKGVHAGIWRRALVKEGVLPGLAYQNRIGLKRLIEALEEYSRRRNGRPGHFTNKLLHRARGHKYPTEKQLTAINNMLEAEGMRRVSCPISGEEQYQRIKRMRAANVQQDVDNYERMREEAQALLQSRKPPK